MAASGMGLCRQCTFLIKGMEFWGPGMDFNQNVHFKDSPRWTHPAIIPVGRPGCRPSHVACNHNAPPWPNFAGHPHLGCILAHGAPKHHKYGNGVWIWYGF